MLSKLWKWVRGAINEIAEFFSPLAAQIARSGGQLLLEAAWAGVTAAEREGGSGETKFKRAKAEVIATLEKQGQAFVLNAVHGAIEAAVAKLEASK